MLASLSKVGRRFYIERQTCTDALKVVFSAFGNPGLNAWKKL